jgi:hypothetical protein
MSLRWRAACSPKGEAGAAWLALIESAHRRANVLSRSAFFDFRCWRKYDEVDEVVALRHVV